MSIRHVAKTVAVSLAALSAASAISLTAFAPLAGASGPADGTIVPGADTAVAPFTAGTPFSSGQLINIVIPANSDLSPTKNLNVVECSAPGGVIPTDPSVCDGNTINGPTLKPNADGSVNFQTFTHQLYQVFALPDSIDLGESSGPACDLTDECILYIGQNQTDFTQPHFWSPGFFVAPNGADDGSNPGDGSAPPTPTTTTSVSGTPATSVVGQSVTLTATVTTNVPGECTPSGSVSFADGSTPLGTGTIAGGSATLATSALSEGSHTIKASFGGSTGCPASSGTATETVGQASTTTSVTGVPVGGSISGQSVTFTATVAPVAPGAGTPTGTITFKDGTSTIGTGTLSGGTASTSTSTLPSGSQSITAVYGGDTNFIGSTGALTYAVNLASSSTALAAVPASSSVFGQSVTFTATVSPVAPATATPTGTVTFKDGTTQIGTTQTLSAAGTASVSTSALAVASHSITATYSGSSSVNGSSAMSTYVVGQATTTTSVVPAPASPSVSGQSVTFTATVAPVAPGAGAPTGSVTFTDGATTLGTGTLSAGTATFTSSTLAVGGHAITATYGGDTNFSTSTTPSLQYAVTQASSKSTLVSSANPSTPGESVTLTDTVATVAPGAGTPTGSVTFEDGSTTLGTGTLAGGVATLTTSTLALGTHPITAVYAGNTNVTGSTSNSVSQVVANFLSTTSVTSSVNPSTPGQSVTFTATVAAAASGEGTPTGTVTVNDGATVLGTGTLSAAGTATLTTSTLALGTHPITVTYAGAGAFSGSTSATLSQVVALLSSKTTVTSSANPSGPAQSVTFTATVAGTASGEGTPTGTVTFNDGATVLGTGTLSAAGTATLTTSTLALGTHPITVTYAGAGAFSGSTSATLSQVVALFTTSTAVTSSVNPSGPGQSVTFTATVAATASGEGTPAGTVTFKDGTTVLGTGTLSAAGTATLATSTLAIGTHAITVSYAGGGPFSGSTSAVLSQVVGRFATVLTGMAEITLLPYSSDYPAVEASLSVAGGLPVAGQTITFTAAGVTLCSAVTNAAGTAVCVPSGLGQLYLILGFGFTATFAGSPSYAPSTGAAPLLQL